MALLDGLFQNMKVCILGSPSSSPSDQYTLDTSKAPPSESPSPPSPSNAPVSPPSLFDRIPNEILAEIFLYCLRDIEIAKPHRYYSPLLPRSVCRRWREVASHCPELWTRIAIHVTQHTISILPDRFCQWIESSGACPLSVMMSVELADFGPLDRRHRTYRDALDILTKLVVQASRLRQVILCVPVSLLSAALPLHSSPMPLLERLELSVDYPSGFATDDPGLELDEILPNAPRLQELKWLAGGFLSLSQLPQSWGRLTKLRISFVITLSQCANVLRACPLLTSVGFDFVSVEGKVERLLPFQHDRLQSLAINGPVEPRFLLANLTAPALRSLQLTYSSERSYAPFSNDVLPDFITRSACPLEELVVENAALQEAELYQVLLETSHTLIKMDVWNDCESVSHSVQVAMEERVVSCISERVLKALTFPKNDGSVIIVDAIGQESRSAPLCPKLRVFKYRGAISAPDGMVAAMVESRWKSSPVEHGIVGCLQTVLVEFKADRPLDTSRLRYLRTMGLDCRVFAP